MNIRKISLIVVAAIIIVGIVMSNSSQENHDVKIGAALSFSGPASTSGENIKNGMELAKIKLLEEGIDLEIIYEDDETSPQKTVSAMSKLVNVDNVDAIVGPTWSFLASAADKTIQDNKIVSFCPANTSEFVDSSSDYLIFGAPRNAEKEKEVEKWLIQEGSSKVAIVVINEAWGNSHMKPFSNAIENVGAELVLIEKLPFEISGPDMQTVIAKIINSGADSVLYTAFDEHTALIINKKQDMGAEFSLLAATETIKRHSEEGRINVSEEDDIYTLIPKVSDDFQKYFKAEFGVLPGSYADRAYDGTMMLAYAISEKPEDMELKDYIKEMSYEGYMGTYNFDENNDVIGGEWIVEQVI